MFLTSALTRSTSHSVYQLLEKIPAAGIDLRSGTHTGSNDDAGSNVGAHGDGRGNPGPHAFQIETEHARMKLHENNLRNRMGQGWQSETQRNQNQQHHHQQEQKKKKKKKKNRKRKTKKKIITMNVNPTVDPNGGALGRFLLRNLVGSAE